MAPWEKVPGGSKVRDSLLWAAKVRDPRLDDLDTAEIVDAVASLSQEY